MRERAPAALTAEQLEDAARVTLPAHAVVESTTYVAFQDSYLTAVVRLPASELEEFLSGSGFGETTAGLRAVTNADRPDDDGWDPDGASGVAGVSQTTDPVDGVFRRLLVDTGGDDQVVYLVAFTT